MVCVCLRVYEDNMVVSSYKCKVLEETCLERGELKTLDGKTEKWRECVYTVCVREKSVEEKKLCAQCTFAGADAYNK